jgi:GT2 family glycosyltransferase
MKTNYPLISVVIVNWNGVNWNKKILENLREQSYEHLEIIFIDNASTDKSLEQVEREFPGIIIIKNKTNLGFAGGNNRGISIANGSLIMLINNDTWVHSNFVRDLYLFYKNHTYDVVAPYEADYLGHKKQPYITTIDLLGHPVYKFGVFDQSYNFYLSGCCILFAKDLYLDSLGLDDDFFMYFEEIDWFWRLKLIGKNVAYADSVYINHAGSGSTGSGIKYSSFLWRNQNTLQMLLKNYRFINLIWILPVYLFQNLLESLAFLIIGKPEITKSYAEGILFNLKNIKIIARKRKVVQNMRTTPDIQIINYMYVGLGKVRHLRHLVLKNYLKKKAKNIDI